MKRLRAVAILALILTGSVIGVMQFGRVEVQQLRRQVDELQVEKKHLQDFAEHLAASRRVAQISVIRERRGEAGEPVFTLQWQELARNGLVSPPVEVEVVGRIAYFEACTIKFDHDLIGNADPDRGETLVMYRRVFGEQQAPQKGPSLEQVRPPAVGGEDSPAKQAELWKRFWEMVDDPQLQARYGVRVAQLEAPAAPIKLGQVWELTLDADGGLNLRRISTMSPAPSENHPSP